MLKKLKLKRGFTLVEMLVAMSIFVIFTGLIINSYASIVKSQRDANEFRIVYADARSIFESLVWELREGMVDYKHYEDLGTTPSGALEVLYLISRDANLKTKIEYDSTAKDIFVSNFSDKIKLNNNVKLVDFKMYVSPVIDPYDVRYVENDKNQFQPKVTIYAEFENNLKLQTTISSRIYNQVY